MRRILITGGTGFFGKSMLDYRRRHSDRARSEWIILSRNPKRFIRDYPMLATQSGVSFVAGDIRDFDPSESRLDAIIHAAAVLNPTATESEILSTTIDGTRHIVDVAKNTGCGKVLYTSSGAVYGALMAPVSEEAKCRPTTPYGHAKVEAEKLLIHSGLDVRIARCFSFVGKYLDWTIYYAIGNFIRDVLSGNDIVIQGDGSPVRSYLYADDLVEWLCAILERGESGRVYNVGSDEAISIRDLACLVRDELKSTGKVKVLGNHLVGAANCYVPNVDRIRKELCVSVKMGLREAIARSAVFGGDCVRVV